MKTYLVYSKKKIQFISSIDDISDIVFVKYGFNWFYAADFLNVLYSIRRKFYVLTAALIAGYLLLPENFAVQFLFVSLFGFLAYIFEIFFLKRKKYSLIGTIEAKNSAQAKELFIKEYILCQMQDIHKNIVVKG